MEEVTPKLHMFHIPRTGGMSVLKFIATTRRRLKKVGKPSPFTFRAQGHTHFKKCREPWKTMIILRDPIKHSASLYGYIRTNRRHHQHLQARQLSFHEYATTMMCDSFVGFLAQKGDLELALEHLKTFTYIAFTDTLNEDMQWILDDLESGLSWGKTHHNRGREKVKIEPKTIKFIKKKRAKDYEILEYAKKLRGL